MPYRLVRMLAILLLILATACAKGGAPLAAAPVESGEPAPSAGDAGAGYGEQTSIDFEDASVGGALARPSPSRAPGGAAAAVGAARSGVPSASPPPKQAPQQAASPPEPAKKRMIHYTGWLSLRVARTDAAVDAVAALASELGGYVESLAPARITVRIPVERFREAWDRAHALGELLEESLSAEDVTEAYTALDLRLGVSLASRARLIALLARAKSEEEKLALLGEIQRLSEEIEAMQARLQALASLAAYSRLTVQATARGRFTGQAGQEEVAGFGWISRLAPYRRDVAGEGRPLKLPVPAGFVALDEDRLVAESADGAIFWTSRRFNEPRGDADFWMAALRSRLEPAFAQASVERIGDFQVLRLVEAGREPLIYRVALRVQGRELELVEITFPTAAHEARHAPAVRAALGGPSA